MAKPERTETNLMDLLCGLDTLGCLDQALRHRQIRALFRGTTTLRDYMQHRPAHGTNPRCSTLANRRFRLSRRRGIQI